MALSSQLSISDPHLAVVTLCEARIKLKDDWYKLVPTLRGVLVICQAGGFNQIIGRILSEDFEAVLIGLEAGLQLKPKKLKKLPELLFRSGLEPELISTLVEFLENLARGGKLEAEEHQTASNQVRLTAEEITLEQWVDKLFTLASGWTNYSPEIILNSNINLIKLAIDGKLDFVKKTNPFGSSDEDKEAQSVEELEKAPPNPELAAFKLQQFFKRRLNEQKRNDGRMMGRVRVKK